MSVVHVQELLVIMASDANLINLNNNLRCHVVLEKKGTEINRSQSSSSTTSSSSASSSSSPPPPPRGGSVVRGGGGGGGGF